MHCLSKATSYIVKICLRNMLRPWVLEESFKKHNNIIKEQVKCRRSNPILNICVKSNVGSQFGWRKCAISSVISSHDNTITFFICRIWYEMLLRIQLPGQSVRLYPYYQEIIGETSVPLITLMEKVMQRNKNTNSWKFSEK